MPLVKDDQADIIDERGVAPKREIEFFRRRDDDVARSQRVFITLGDTGSAVER